MVKLKVVSNASTSESAEGPGVGEGTVPPNSWAPMSTVPFVMRGSPSRSVVMSELTASLLPTSMQGELADSRPS